MLRYSVLVPQRGAVEALTAQLPALARVLDLLALPYEVVCIDDASPLAARADLVQLLERYPFLRAVCLDRPAGLSAALSAGISAARGQIIVATAVGRQYLAEQIPHLIAGLARGDLAFGRRPCKPLQKAWQRVTRLPRWMLLGLDVRDPECLFWAARREAVHGLDLTRGMSRYLPSLVAMRGFRVTEVPVVAQEAASNLAECRPNPGDLLAAWWLRRRYRPAKIEELRRASTAPAPRAALPVRWPDAAHFPDDRRNSA